MPAQESSLQPSSLEVSVCRDKHVLVLGTPFRNVGVLSLGLTLDACRDRNNLLNMPDGMFDQC